METQPEMVQQSDPGPIRTCVGCRQRRPQAELVRCVLAADGIARVDRHGPGRGAWLCGSACFEPAVRRKAFARAWRSSLAPIELERALDGLRTRFGAELPNLVRD